MRSRFRPSPAMIVACIALFVAIGGTATAVTYVVSSNSQVGPGTISGHAPPTGKHANVIPNSINGRDIKDRSGVDTCQTPLLVKLGAICAGSDGVARTFPEAMNHCAGFGLRLPSLSEATTLAEKYDVPGISGNSEFFWTDEEIVTGTSLQARVVTENGGSASSAESNTNYTVCVTDPSA